MNDTKVEWFKANDNLSEIYQNTQMQFSFLSSEEDGNKQCHLFVLCRDFLHDAVRAYLTKDKCSIYGFYYNYKNNPPVTMDSMRMLVTKKGLTKATDIVTFGKYMKCALSLLNHYEAMAKWKKSHLEKVKDDGRHVWLFTGSSMWMKSPFLISMHSFIIRLGVYENLLSGFTDNDDLIKRYKDILNANGATGNDVRYLGECYDKMHLVIKKRKTLFFDKKRIDATYYDKQSIGQFHNNNGIYNLCRNQSSKGDISEIIKE